MLALSRNTWIGFGVAAAAVGGLVFWWKKSSASSTVSSTTTTVTTTTTTSTAAGKWTDPDHYTDVKGNVWTSKMEGGAWQATSPLYTWGPSAAAMEHDTMGPQIDAYVTTHPLPVLTSAPTLSTSTPPIWTAPPTAPAGWTLPPAWIPPAGWIPPWISTTVPKDSAGMVDPDYQVGYGAGIADAAIYPVKFIVPAGGINQDPIRYASSATYKAGYDQGWIDFMTPATAAAATKGTYVGAGMPRQWWNALPRATGAEYGLYSTAEAYPFPWRG